MEPFRPSQTVPSMIGEEKEVYDAERLARIVFLNSELGLPPMQTVTIQEHPSYKEPTVCLLAETGERLAHIREGGRQAPGCVFLVLTPSWIERGVNEHDPKLASLFLHRGLCYEGDQLLLKTFEHPRRVTYFANFLTLGVSDKWRDDGVPYEFDLDCPCASSSWLEQITSDKLHTRITIAGNGVNVPRCIAFPFQSPRLYKSLDGRIFVTPLSTRTGHTRMFEEHVQAFISGLQLTDRVVVKPSGPTWMQSIGVSFHSVTDIAGIVAALEELLLRLNAGDVLLVDEFIHTIAPRNRPTCDWENAVDADQLPPPPQLAFHIRSIVQRTPWDTAKVTKALAYVGVHDRPMGGHNTFEQTLDATLHAWGIAGDERLAVLQRLHEHSERAFMAISDSEKQLTVDEKGSILAQTEALGLDVLLTERDGVIAPVIIEMNDHDCTNQAQRLEYHARDTSGECCRVWVSTMVARSLRWLMSERTLLVLTINASSTVERAVAVHQDLGMRIIVVNPTAAVVTDDKARVIVVPELGNDELDVDKITDSLLCTLQSTQDVHVDGVLTFEDAAAPIAVRVAEKLGVPGPINPTNFVDLALDRTRLFETVMRLEDDSAVKPAASHYVGQSALVTCVENLSAVLPSLKVPVVLRRRFLSPNESIRVLCSERSALAEFERINAAGNQLQVMEWSDGTQHSVAVILWNGEMIGAYVQDCSPSGKVNLHTDNITHLSSAAHQLCRDLSLRFGVFQVDMRSSSRGPRLVDLHPRVPDAWVCANVKQIEGVDLVQVACEIACGVRPILTKLRN